MDWWKKRIEILCENHSQKLCDFTGTKEIAQPKSSLHYFPTGPVEKTSKHPGHLSNKQTGWREKRRDKKFLAQPTYMGVYFCQAGRALKLAKCAAETWYLRPDPSPGGVLLSNILRRRQRHVTNGVRRTHFHSANAAPPKHISKFAFVLHRPGHSHCHTAKEARLFSVC